MTNAGRLGLLTAILAVCIAAVRWSTRRATSVVAQQSLIPGAERAPSDLSPKPELSTPEGRRTEAVLSSAIDSAGRAPTAQRPVYRADVVSAPWALNVVERPAEWSARPADDWRIAAVRLSDACVQFVPLGDASTPIRISDVRDRTFELRGYSSAEDTPIECELSSMGMDRLSNMGDVVRDDRRSVAFADAYTIQATELPEETTLAYCRMQLSVAQPVVVEKLPAGDYRIAGRSAPFGWWIDEGTITVGEGPTILRAVPLRVTSVTLPVLADGGPKVPIRVAIVEHQRPRAPREGESTGELSVETQRTDNALLIANHHALVVDSHTDFAFIFYWPDGSQTTTRYGSAADLLESVDLRR